jgi:hypothetical protein
LRHGTFDVSHSVVEDWFGGLFFHHLSVYRMLEFFGNHFGLLAELFSDVGQEVISIHGFDMFGFASTKRFECVLLK